MVVSYAFFVVVCLDVYAQYTFYMCSGLFTYSWGVSNLTIGGLGVDFRYFGVTMFHFPLLVVLIYNTQYARTPRLGFLIMYVEKFYEVALRRQYSRQVHL